MNRVEASKAMIVAAFAAVYVIWGSTYLAIRFAIETMPPFTMAAARFIVAGLLLYAWARFRGVARPTLVEWRATAIVGGFLLLGGNGLVVWAEQTVPSGIAALVVATVPLWIVGLGWLTGSRPQPVVVAGLLAGLFGVAWLVGPSGLDTSVPFDLAGIAGLLLASCLWAIGSLYSIKAPLPKSSPLSTGMQMIAGGLWLAAAAGLSGESIDLASVSGTSTLALGYLIFFGAIIGYSAYVWLLRAVSPAKVATYAYVNPVVAVLLGWWLAGEEVTPRTVTAAAIIVAAVGLITTARGRAAAPSAEDAPTAAPQGDEQLCSEPAGGR